MSAPASIPPNPFCWFSPLASHSFLTHPTSNTQLNTQEDPGILIDFVLPESQCLSSTQGQHGLSLGPPPCSVVGKFSPGSKLGQWKAHLFFTLRNHLSSTPLCLMIYDENHHVVCFPQFLSCLKYKGKWSPRLHLGWEAEVTSSNFVLKDHSGDQTKDGQG